MSRLKRPRFCRMSVSFGGGGEMFSYIELQRLTLYQPDLRSPRNKSEPWSLLFFNPDRIIPGTPVRLEIPNEMMIHTPDSSLMDSYRGRQQGGICCCLELFCSGRSSSWSEQLLPATVVLLLLLFFLCEDSVAHTGFTRTGILPKSWFA